MQICHICYKFADKWFKGIYLCPETFARRQMQEVQQQNNSEKHLANLK